MTLYEQDEFFKKELKALQSYFSDMIILSAVVHHDEAFRPQDEEMKALLPAGKITPHMPKVCRIEQEYEISSIEEAYLFFIRYL